MFITLALTAFIVMFLIWRINRDMPGVLHWMLATLLNTASALASLLHALAGGDDDWGLFLSNSISMAANVLVLEGDNADMLLGVADAGMYRDKKGEKQIFSKTVLQPAD